MANLQSENNLSDVENVATSRTNLGLGTAAVQSATTFAQGGAALTTVGAIPYVSASGFLNQDSHLNWDAANDRLLIGLDAGVQAKVSAFNVDFNSSGDRALFYGNWSQNVDTTGVVDGFKVLLSGDKSVGNLTALNMQAFYGGQQPIQYVTGVNSVVGNNTHGTGDQDEVAAYRVDHSFNSSAAVNHAYAYMCILGIAPGVSGTVTDYKGFYFITPQVAAPGEVINQYAFYAEDVTGASGDNYAIYTKAGRVRLGDFVEVEGPVRVKSYTVTTVPAANVGAGQIIYVSNETGGAVLAFSDGTNWRRVTDRAIIA